MSTPLLAVATVTVVTASLTWTSTSAPAPSPTCPAVTLKTEDGSGQFQFRELVKQGALCASDAPTGPDLRRLRRLHVRLGLLLKHAVPPQRALRPGRDIRRHGQYLG